MSPSAGLSQESHDKFRLEKAGCAPPEITRPCSKMEIVNTNGISPPLAILLNRDVPLSREQHGREPRTEVITNLILCDIAEKN